MLIDTTEAGRRLGVSRMRVVQLLNEKRIPNASKIGGQRGIWVIEVGDDAPPAVIDGDRRRKKKP